MKDTTAMMAKRLVYVLEYKRASGWVVGAVYMTRELAEIDGKNNAHEYRIHERYLFDYWTD